MNQSYRATRFGKDFKHRGAQGATVVLGAANPAGMLGTNSWAQKHWGISEQEVGQETFQGQRCEQLGSIVGREVLGASRMSSSCGYAGTAGGIWGILAIWDSSGDGLLALLSCSHISFTDHLVGRVWIFLPSPLLISGLWEPKQHVEASPSCTFWQSLCRLTPYSSWTYCSGLTLSVWSMGWIWG